MKTFFIVVVTAIITSFFTYKTTTKFEREKKYHIIWVEEQGKKECLQVFSEDFYMVRNLETREEIEFNSFGELCFYMQGIYNTRVDYDKSTSENDKFLERCITIKRVR